MTRVLSELLAASEPLFTNMLRKLEVESGHPDIDVRITAEIANNVSRKIKELGLDPSDTNGLELYHALQALVKKHDGYLAAAVGGKDPADVADLMPRLISKTKSLPIVKTCWAIKHATAKRLLKAMPPKKIMKILSYRSVDSMLKRESIDELYAALRFVESASWLNKFINSYKKLRPSDFEVRDINILNMSDRWIDSSEDFVYSHRHNIVTLKEMGVIGVLPLPMDRLQGVSITVLPLMIHYINEIRLYSSFFKLQQVKPNFANILVNTLIKDAADLTTLVGEPLHWRTIQRYFGKLSKSRHPEVFEPHVQPEDLAWKSAEDVLYKIEPALKFWEGMDYSAAMHDGRAVPLGLMDNAANYCNRLGYGEHTIRNFQDSLWNELLARYIGQEALEEDVVKQLDSENSELEPLMAGLGDLG